MSKGGLSPRALLQHSAGITLNRRSPGPPAQLVSRAESKQSYVMTAAMMPMAGLTRTPVLRALPRAPASLRGRDYCPSLFPREDSEAPSG